MSPEDIGRFVRLKRRQCGLRQAELAALANVGGRFISELENGKASLELGRVLKVLDTVGLDMSLRERSWRTILSADDE